MAGGFEIKGLEELTKNLGSLSSKVEVKILKKAVQDLAAGMVNDLKARAPISDPKTQKRHPPGLLKDSLKIGTDARKVKGRIKVTVNGEFYARFLEGGTKYINAEKHKFIGPYIDREGQQMLDHVLTIISNEVEDRL